MLYKLITKFPKLLVIVFVSMECTPMLWPEKFLNDAITYSPQSVSEIVNSENRNLQRAIQASFVGNHENTVSKGTNKIKRTVKRDEKSKLDKQGPKIWDQWGKWSSCSVTCGIGTLTRWRHCISGGCLFGEKKAQLRTCTLSAC